MKKLLKPFVVLVSKMKYSMKFAVVSFLFLIPIAILLYTFITANMAELRENVNDHYGIERVTEVMPLMLQVQQHRGLMNGYLNGNESAKSKIEARQAEIADTISQLNQQLEASKTPDSMKKWEEVQEAWEALRSSGGTMKPDENFQQHSLLIENIRQLMMSISDETGLSLSNDISIYYFMNMLVEELPQLIENSAVIRGLGNGTLSSGQLADDTRIELLLAEAQTYSALESLEKSLANILRETDSLDEELALKAEAAVKSTKSYLSVLDQEILGAESFTVKPEEFFDFGTATIQVANELYGLSYNELNRLLDQQRSTLQSYISFMMIMTAAVLILVTLFYTAFYSNVIDTVRTLKIRAEEMASGDFSKDIRVNTKDELSDVSQAMILMQQDMNRIFGQNQQISDRTAASSEELMAISQESTQAMQQIAASVQDVSEGTDLQQRTIGEVSTAMNEMSLGISRIAEAASEVSDVAIQASESAAQGDEQLAETVQQMKSIKQTQEQSAQVIAKLDDHSAEIGKIIQAVMAITQQTKLLSLNANIEASRAGEAGRGFSVVAKEIGKLAEETAQSGQVISGLLNDIRGLVEEAVAAMLKMQQETDQGIDTIDKSKRMIDRILENIQVVSEQIQEVSASSEELSAEMEEVTASIAEVALISEKTSGEAGTMAAAAQQQLASMEEIQASSEELRDLSQQLQEDLSKFKLKA